ncbi:MAG: DUF4263 domain-containing protein [Candidatus ainarchaeum sp.]|nr:DUF4263 domain-containing protein [Candidatus ainarchaeum sp.]
MTDEKTPAHDMKLGEPYESLAEETVYSEKNRSGKIFAAKNKKTGEEFVRFLSDSKKPRRGGSKWFKNYGFNLHTLAHLESVLFFLKKIAKVVGWKPTIEDEVQQLQMELHEKQQLIENYQIRQKDVEQQRDDALKKVAEKIIELSKTRLPDFKNDVEELDTKIKNVKVKKISEADLQEFLYAHSWLFGLEYITAEPQKLRGAYSKFDFYLERYNKTNDIVEIKLISDEITNSDGSVSAKVIQAVDQLINYMESAIAAAHSTVIADEEGINELRPRGIVIIGNDATPEAVKKIRKWNYQLSHIKIMTYEEVLTQGKAIIDNIEGKYAQTKVQTN